MREEKILLRSDNHFCDSSLKWNLDGLEKDNDCDKDKDMKNDRSCETECLSFEFGIVFKDRSASFFHSNIIYLP